MFGGLETLSALGKYLLNESKMSFVLHMTIRVINIVIDHTYSDILHRSYCFLVGKGLKNLILKQ
jgi:hypothetical protein